MDFSRKNEGSDELVLRFEKMFWDLTRDDDGKWNLVGLR